MDFSLLRQLTLNPFRDKEFGFQVRLGNEDVGLPLWTTGTGQALLILRNKIFEQKVCLNSGWCFHSALVRAVQVPCFRRERWREVGVFVQKG